MAKTLKIGIIGGSGLDDPDILKNPEEIEVDTPYGRPSSSLKVGKISNVNVVLLARHGRHHEIPPSKVNYRANIYALKELGCDYVLTSTAVGSLKEEIQRGDLVILDQFIDFTRHRHITFHDTFKKGPAHTSLAEPFCNNLRNLLIETAKELKYSHHRKGTVITIEGPRFSTKAESNVFRSWGADVINMSIAPEATLAKEAGICYAAVAMNTDYDCWKDDEEPVSWDMILDIFSKNSDKVKQIFLNVIPKIHTCLDCQKPSIDIVSSLKDPIAKDTLCLTPTWDQMHYYAKEVSNLMKESNFHPEIIIGLSRGGLVPARMIADLMHVKNCYTIKVDHWGLTATKDGQAKLSQDLNINIANKRVLIVDDITDTGQSMELAKKHLESFNPAELKTATLINLFNSKYIPDFFGYERSWAWIVFPWNRTEDLINLIQKIENFKEKPLSVLKEELKEKFALDIQEEEISSILEHLAYLKNKKVI